MKVGDMYLAIDPTQMSGAVVDIRRIWAERVPVELVQIHRARIRNRYTVRGPDGTEWDTGRLEPLKPVRHYACA
jgi:hypothetical protein